MDWASSCEPKGHTALIPGQGVTEQTGACPCGALVNDPTISAGRNRSLFTIFQLWGTWSPPFP